MNETQNTTLPSDGCLVCLLPDKRDIEKEICRFGGNFVNDDIFKSMYYLSRGFALEDIPEIFARAKQQQLLATQCINEINEALDTTSKSDTDN